MSAKQARNAFEQLQYQHLTPFSPVEMFHIEKAIERQVQNLKEQGIKDGCKIRKSIIVALEE
jgi:hypothetical protein